MSRNRWHFEDPRATAEFIELLEAIVRTFGGRRGAVSAREAKILEAISTGAACTAMELVVTLGISKSHVNRFLLRLEKKRLIARCRAANDLRTHKLELTAEGERARRTPVRFEHEAVAAALGEFEDRIPALRVALRTAARIQHPPGYRSDEGGR
jgi:DNA-binding MarR family transcriptional regulator